MKVPHLTQETQMLKVTVRLEHPIHKFAEANEAKIVWPEDAVLSKEDEFTFYDRVLVDDVEYKIGDCIEMWGDEVSL